MFSFTSMCNKLLEYMYMYTIYVGRKALAEYLFHERFFVYFRLHVCVCACCLLMFAVILCHFFLQRMQAQRETVAAKYILSKEKNISDPGILLLQKTHLYHPE